MAKVEVSRYKTSRHRIDNIKYKGFDYRGRMLLKSMDNNLLKAPAFADFAVKIEDVLNWLVFKIKDIKRFSNIFIEKDSDDIN